VGARARAEAIVEVLHKLQASEAVARSLLMLPLTYCYAFVNQWLWARRHGRELVQTRGFMDPLRLETLLDRAAEAMLCLVGHQAVMLLDLFGVRAFTGIIRLHFAGGRFPQEHLDRLERMFPQAAIFNNYGCAEAMPRLTLRPARVSDSALDIGSPLPGIELATGGSGELLFRSPYAAVGFVDRDGWHGVRSDDFVATGDLGARDERGRWILSGRSNEVFKRYGEKIAIAQILDRLLPAWPGQVASYREVDRAGEQGFVLVLCPVPTEAQVRALLRLLRAHFTRSHWPLRIESVEAIPLLANGKPDHAALRTGPSKTMHWHQRV
jgi:acyl-CoA synthetase (AMP-forming)/AMP-acid ligase II